MTTKFRILSAAASMAILFAMSGVASAQKKTDSATPKNDQKSAESKDATPAPPPMGPDGFGPRRGAGRMGQDGRRGDGPGMGRGMRRGMGPGRMGRKPRRGMMFLGLGLTDEQKTKIQGIMKSSKPTDTQRDEMRSLMVAQRAGLLTETQQARLKAIRNEQRDKRDATQTQVMAVLTAEQKAKLEERRAMGMRRGMMDRRGPGMGPKGDRQGPPPPPRKEEN